jgi:hypothetical protein
MAWRGPSRGERHAIVSAAQDAQRAEPTKPVHVSDIRISTVGPWASAAFTLYFGNEGDSALAMLRKVRGRWVITAHSPGTEGVQCGIGMPHKDQRNLGLGVC